MKLVQSRTLLLLALLFSVLFPEMLVSVAQAQTKSFGSQMMDALGIFITPFAILVVGGFTLIIYNGIAIRRKAFVKDDVVQPIMQELQNLNIEGAKALCDQYKLPVTGVLKGGLERIQDDELDIESIEKGLEETSALELAKPFTWINMLNTIGSIAPMIGLLGTVLGMIGAFDALGAGAQSNQESIAGSISLALTTTLLGLVIAIPCVASVSWLRSRIDATAAEAGRELERLVLPLELGADAE